MDKGFVVLCNCGCGNGLAAHILDGQVYVSALSSDFYTGQGYFKQLRFAGKLLLGKKKRNVIKDVLCEKEDLIAFRDYLLTAGYEDEEPFENTSRIIPSWDKDFGFGLYLVADQPRWEALKMKNFRMFDIVLSKKERDILVKRINRVLKKEEDFERGQK